MPPSLLTPTAPHLRCGIPKFIPVLLARRPGVKKNDTWRRQGSGRQAVPLVKVPDLG